MNLFRFIFEIWWCTSRFCSLRGFIHSSLCRHKVFPGYWGTRNHVLIYGGSFPSLKHFFSSAYPNQHSAEELGDALGDALCHPVTPSCDLAGLSSLTSGLCFSSQWDQQAVSGWHCRLEGVSTINWELLWVWPIRSSSFLWI